jgi:hypothetical protein
MTTLLIILGVAVLAVGAAVALFFLGMRAHSRIVRGLLIRFTRDVMNPIQMKSAGKPGAYAGIVRNRGRSSGRIYETPIVAVEVPGEREFLIALPYGTQANWVRNVLAAGSAELVHDGRVHAVDRPEIVAMSAVEGAFSPADQRAHRMTRVNECLRLRDAGVQPA